MIACKTDKPSLVIATSPVCFVIITFAVVGPYIFDTVLNNDERALRTSAVFIFLRIMIQYFAIIQYNAILHTLHYTSPKSPLYRKFTAN